MPPTRLKDPLLTKFRRRQDEVHGNRLVSASLLGVMDNPYNRDGWLRDLVMCPLRMPGALRPCAWRVCRYNASCRHARLSRLPRRCSVS